MMHWVRSVASIADSCTSSQVLVFASGPVSLKRPLVCLGRPAMSCRKQRNKGASRSERAITFGIPQAGPMILEGD